MSGSTADRNLLFGVLALQMDFIEEAQLVAGMRAWINEKQVSLAEHLIRQGALQPADRAVLEPLIAAHLRRHENDVEKSLASISSVREIRRSLEVLDDNDVQQSLRNLTVANRSDDALLNHTTDWAESRANGTRFRVLRPYARGALGEVFVAHDTELLREVALKEIQIGKDDADSRARFMREAEITGKLEHPGIVPVYSLGTYADGRPFYAMRFIRGQSLHDAIREFYNDNPSAESGKDQVPAALAVGKNKSEKSSRRNLQLRRLLQRFIDVCEAIDYAHSRGVLHRDLKPGNIMLGRYGETLVVDWGLAKVTEDVASPAPVDNTSIYVEPRLTQGESSSATMQGSMIGTPAYMPPEQAEGRLDLLCPASDVYSLGATLYCILTGQPPVKGQNIGEVMENVRNGNITTPRVLAPDIPKALEAICLKALSRQIAQRYSTAKQLAAEIERYLGDEAVEAVPENVWSRANRWSRRNRQWVFAGAMTMFVIACTAIGAYYYQRETALQNLQLAEEKGSLAIEKGNLAVKESEARQTAEANYVKLRTALMKHSFSQGVTEYAGGHTKNSLIEFQRALVLSKEGGAQTPSGYERVIGDRYLGGGCYVGLPLCHEANVTAVAFCPNGNLVVTGDAKGSAQLWDARTGAIVGKPFLVESAITGLEFSPSADRVAILAMGGLTLWDVQSGTQLDVTLKESERVTSMAFSPDGSRLVACGMYTSARVLEAASGEIICETESQSVWDVAYDPSGKKFVTACDDGYARLWDADNGSLIGKLFGGRKDKRFVYKNPCVSVAFNSRGDRIATGSQDGWAQLWDAETQVQLGKNMDVAVSVKGVVFSPRGDRLFVVRADRITQAWDVRTGEYLGEPLGRTPVRALAFSPQGNRVLVCGYDDTAHIHDLSIEDPLGFTMRNSVEMVSADFSPQGDRVVTGGADFAARLRDAGTGQAIGSPLKHSGVVTIVSIDPKGERILTGSEHILSIWNSDTSSPWGDGLLPAERLHQGTGGALGDNCVVTINGESVRLADLNSGAENRGPPRSRIECATLSPKGDCVLVGGLGTEAWLWDLRTQSIERLKGHKSKVVSVAYSPKGDRFLTGSDDATAILWDAQSRKALSVLPHEEAVLSVAFSPSGDRLVTGSRDNRGRLWNAQTGQLVCEPLSHEREVKQVCFNPQGDTVLTADTEGTARLWNADTGTPIGNPMRLKGAVLVSKFSSSGDRILTSSSDFMAQIWNAVQPPTPPELIDHLEWATGVRFDSNMEAVSLTSEQRNELAQRLAGQKTWLEQVKAWNEERDRHYHLLALTRAMTASEPDPLITEFHLKWVSQFDAEAAREWETKLGARRREIADPSRVRWKNSTNEFIRTSATEWVEKVSDGAVINFLEHDRQAEYVELFDNKRKLYVRLYADKVLMKLEGESDYRPLYTVGSWVE
ncbi:MAG: protein kinase [Pirellulales bacterium]